MTATQFVNNDPENPLSETYKEYGSNNPPQEHTYPGGKKGGQEAPAQGQDPRLAQLGQQILQDAGNQPGPYVVVGPEPTAPKPHNVGPGGMAALGAPTPVSGPSGGEDIGGALGARSPAVTAASANQDQMNKLAELAVKMKEDAGDTITMETYTAKDGVDAGTVGQAKTAYRIEKADGKENRVEISDIKYQAGPDGKPVAESYKEVHKAGRDGSGPEVKQVRKMQIERDAGGKETSWTQLVTKPGNTPGEKVRTIETVRNSQVVSSAPQGGGRAGAVQQAGAEGAQRQGGGFSRQSRSYAVKARQQRIQSSGDRMSQQIDQSAAETTSKMSRIDAAINQANFMNKARAGQQADMQGVKTQKHLGGQGEQPQQQNQQ